MSTATASKIGHITQVIGSTFDVEFDERHLPAIYNALKIDAEQKGVKVKLTGEVQQHLGGGCRERRIVARRQVVPLARPSSLRILIHERSRHVALPQRFIAFGPQHFAPSNAPYGAPFR